MAGHRVRTHAAGDTSDCTLCGEGGVYLERTRNRRRGLAWVNPHWNPEERTYRVCPGCGARQQLIDGQPI